MVRRWVYGFVDPVSREVTLQKIDLTAVEHGSTSNYRGIMEEATGVAALIGDYGFIVMMVGLGYFIIFIWNL